MQATREPAAESSTSALARYAPLWLVLAICLPAPLHFFETFPNGWDQTEYAWCVKEGFLPHSPHVLFFFVGRVLAAVWAPAFALSLLSLGSGFAALFFLHSLLLRLFRESSLGQARAAALVATLLLGTSTVFVRQVATQEAYAFQLSLLLGCAALLAGERYSKSALGSSSRLRMGLAGVLYGCAFAAHNGSAFVLPALLVLVLRSGVRSEGPRNWRALAETTVVWLGCAGATVGLAYGVTALLLPAAPGERLAEAIHYLRGISPGIRIGVLADAGFFSESVGGIARRLTAGDIALTRGPVATGPVGLGVAHLCLGAFGLARLGRREPFAALFLALWPLPFLFYELLLGASPDYGTYVVFVVPAVSVACGYAFAWPLPRGTGQRLAFGALAAGVAIALLAPSATQLAAHWGDPARDQQRHDSPTTLAAVFAAGALPPEAVVVQPRSEWNANVLPFYAERRHVSRVGATLSLLRSRAPYTPMRGDAYDLLTTERLEELLVAGVPVIAFERDPLRGANTGLLDASRFAWRPAGDADLEVAAERLGLSQRRRAKFAGRSLPMFRAVLGGGR